MIYIKHVNKGFQFHSVKLYIWAVKEDQKYFFLNKNVGQFTDLYQNRLNLASINIEELLYQIYCHQSSFFGVLFSLWLGLV